VGTIGGGAAFLEGKTKDWQSTGISMADNVDISQSAAYLPSQHWTV